MIIYTKSIKMIEFRRISAFQMAPGVSYLALKNPNERGFSS